MSNVLFRDYDKVIRDNTFSQTVLLSNLKKNVGVVPIANNNFYVKATSSGFSGWAADNGNAGADFGTGDVSYSEMTVPVRFTWGPYQLTESLLNSADSDAGAVVDIAEDYAKHVQQSLRRNLNRMFLNRGGTEADNAVIATVNGASAGTTVTVDSGAGSDSSGPGLGTLFMYVGQGLVFGTDAEIGAGSADYGTVASIDSLTQITIDAAETIADADNIVNARAASDTNDNNEMNGFRNIVSTTNTFQNIDRTTNYWWHSSSDTAAEALDEGDVVSQFLQAKRTGNPNAIIVGDVLYRKYASLLTSMKRAEQDSNLVGGFRGLEFASGGPGVVVSLDWDTPYGDVNIASLDSNFITIGELATGWFGAKQGLPMFQKTNLRGSYWAAYEYFGNLVVRNASAHSGLRNKTA